MRKCEIVLHVPIEVLVRKCVIVVHIAIEVLAKTDIELHVASGSLETI